MKTLKFILNHFLGLMFLLLTTNISGQTITSVTPHTFCPGDVIIVQGTDLDSAYLKLKELALEEDLSSLIISGSDTIIIATIPIQSAFSNISLPNNSVMVEVKKDGDILLASSPITINGSPNVSLTIINGESTDVCQGSSRSLEFSVSGNSSGDNVLITYTINGMIHQTSVLGDTNFDTTVTPTVSMTYIVISIQNLTTGCDFYPSNQTVTFNVAPSISGILSTSDNELCEGESTSIIFNINNPNNDSMKVYYEKNNGATTTIDTTITTSMITLTESPTSTTVYKLTKVENVTLSCDTTITANNEETVTVYKIPAAAMSLSTANEICYGEEIQLGLDNHTTGNEFIKIYYTKGGLANSVIIENDTIIKFPNTSTSTIFTLTGVELANDGCYQNLTNASIPVTVQPDLTGSLSASADTICSGESVNLFFTVNNPNANDLIFYYSDGTDSLTAMTTGTFVSVNTSALTTPTTFILDSIENTTTTCTKTITTNNTAAVTVNNTMGVVMTSSVASLCQNNNYDLTFAITGSKVNDNIQIIYLKDGISIPLNYTINNVSDTVITVPIAGQQTHVYNLLSITNTTTSCVTNYTPGVNNILSVTVTSSIIASITASSTEICNGASTNLIFSVANPDGDSVIISYQDEFGNLFDTTIIGNSVVVPVSPSVSTIYTLDSVEINGCTFPFLNTVAITVNKVPTVTVALSGSGIACSGGTSVQLMFTIDNKNSPNDLVMVQYLDQNGLQSFTTTATTYPVNVTPLSTTVYSLVSVTNMMVGCVNFNVSSGTGSSVTVTAGNNLTGKLQVSRDEVCKGQTVTLNFIINGASDTTELIYTVDGVRDTIEMTGSINSVTTSSLINTTIFQLIGLTAINTGCPGDTIIGSSTEEVKVNTLPDAVLTTVNGANPVAICNGDSTNLQFNITGGTPPYSVAYVETVSNFNTNLTFNAQGTTPVSVNPTQNSVYNIFTVADSKICSDTTPSGTANVTVNPLPTVILTVNNNTLCNGDSTTLTFTVSNNNVTDSVTIQYDEELLSNSITTQKTVTTNNTTTITVAPNLTTTYTITGITNAVTNCIGTPNGNSQTIIVNELPESTITINTAAVCNGDNVLLEFNFTEGVSPFRVFYDSTSISAFTNSMQLDTLTSGSLINQKQENDSSSILENIYFITKVIDGNDCINDYTITGNYPMDTVNINPTPNVSLTGVQPISQPYASTDASIYTLLGIPSGGNIIGAGVGFTTIVNGSTTANFIPANAGFPTDSTSLNISLIYSLTDQTTFCVGSDTVVTILKKALEYNFFNEGATTLDTQYCRNTDSLYIYATVDNNGAVDSIGDNQFILDFSNNNIFSNPEIIGNSARVTLIPLNGSGNFLLKFGSIESGFITKQITIIDTINTSFSPFIDSAFFCQDTGRVQLFGIPTISSSFNSNGSFISPTQNLIISDTISPTNIEWYMVDSIAGTHLITYVYTDTSSLGGCVTKAPQRFTITPRPNADFTTDIDCNNQDVTFIDNSIFTVNTNGSDSIITWKWQFGNGADSIRSDSLPIDYIYGASGVFSAILNVVSALGCTNTFETTVTIGVRPSMNFAWRFETLGEDMEFVNLSTANVSGLLLDSINNSTWNFGDGTNSVMTTLDTILHQYGNTGVFQIGLTAETDNGCSNDTTFNVFVLPKISSYPYYERFNSSDGEWVADPVAGNVWEWADSLVYNNSNRGWTIDSVGTYPLGSDIFVYSPSFDFTAIEKPMVTFRYLVNSRVSDGAVLQYSLNSGLTWIVLGDLESGLEWYNIDNLVAQPGEQTGFSGFAWSGNSDTDWKVARHKLDALKGQPKVRFRIAFASVQGGAHPYDGFAFDDFFVGDRQKRVLMENFTNVGFSGVNYNSIQDTIYQRLSDNDLDVAMVEYHTALPTNDNFNIFNPADPSGRSLYYQFSQTGKTVIDGEIYNTIIPNTTNYGWEQLDLDLAMLEEPEFNIAIDNLIINNGTLDVTTTIKARKPLNAKTRKVYIAVVEDSLSLNNRMHENTLRKLLPSSAGTSLVNSWAIGTAQTVSQSWTFNPNEVDENKLKVIIWIQDNNTKKIYQSAYSGSPNIPFDSTVVNTEVPLEIRETNNFSLFPNPNKGNFTIEFNQAVTIETNWQLVNISGQIIHQGQIAISQESVNIATSDLPKGMYFFRLYNEKGISEIRKVLIH